LKEGWKEQGVTPEELDFSAFAYRCPMLGGLPVETGWKGPPEVRQQVGIFGGIDKYVLWRSREEIDKELEYKIKVKW